MIQVESLRKTFGDRTVVDGISFEIPRGQAFGLLGPNGAGKTTTINMLVGLTQPDSGSVTIAGDAPARKMSRQKIGVAPQALSLYDELSGKENLAFFGTLYSLSGKHLADRIDWALDLAGLQDRQHDRVAKYSGGMKRRLNIAVALIHDPQVLLLDEPTVGVDPQSRNHILDCIRRLSNAGLTILYTTHYMEEVERLCERVGIMDHGKLLAIDSVERLVGAQDAKSQVALRIKHLPDGVALPGTVVEGQLRFESNSPLDAVERLQKQGVEFSEITVTQPNLESVFLSLTGRSLRD